MLRTQRVRRLDEVDRRRGVQHPQALARLVWGAPGGSRAMRVYQLQQN